VGAPALCAGPRRLHPLPARRPAAARVRTGGAPLRGAGAGGGARSQWGRQHCVGGQRSGTPSRRSALHRPSSIMSHDSSGGSGGGGCGEYPFGGVSDASAAGAARVCGCSLCRGGGRAPQQGRRRGEERRRGGEAPLQTRRRCERGLLIHTARGDPWGDYARQQQPEQQAQVHVGGRPRGDSVVSVPYGGNYGQQQQQHGGARAGAVLVASAHRSLSPRPLDSARRPPPDSFALAAASRPICRVTRSPMPWLLLRPPVVQRWSPSCLPTSARSTSRGRAPPPQQWGPAAASGGSGGPPAAHRGSGGGPAPPPDSLAIIGHRRVGMRSPS